MPVRVAITGAGAVSAAGLGVEPLWNTASAGLSQVRHFDLPRGEKLRVKIAAPVPDFEPEEHLSPAEIRRTDRFAQFAHVAAAEAIRQSGLTEAELAGPRTAVIIGSGIGGMNTIDDNCHALFAGGERFNPLTIAKAMPSGATSQVSIVHRITGPSFAVTSACSSGSQAIGVGLQMVRAGLIDRAIVGGSEACITPATMKAWEGMRVLSPDRCRPFSANRNGLVIGEGAGVLILEAESEIKKRKAKPLAWLSGYGTTSDAKDIIQPDVDGAATAMQFALDDAGLVPSDIGYINAHGTGTVLNDANEAAAVNKVFGAAALEIPVSSTKPVIGHALGASGALELIVSMKALIARLVPPNINLDERDPKCDLNLPQIAMELPGFKAVLCNTFAFGGINASLILAPAG